MTWRPAGARTSESFGSGSSSAIDESGTVEESPKAPIAGPSQPPTIEGPAVQETTRAPAQPANNQGKKAAKKAKKAAADAEAADAKAQQAAANAEAQAKAEADALAEAGAGAKQAAAEVQKAAEDAQKAADAEERQATEACTALDQKTAPKPLIPPPIDLCRCRSCTRYYPMEHFPSYCCNGADTTATDSEQTKLSSPLHLCSTVSRRKP